MKTRVWHFTGYCGVFVVSTRGHERGEKVSQVSRYFFPPVNHTTDVVFVSAALFSYYASVV